MGGNAIRCIAKYLYEKNIVRKNEMRIEMTDCVFDVKVYSFSGKVNTASVKLGKVELSGEKIPSSFTKDCVIDQPICVGDTDYRVTLVNLGSPHCVIFTDKVDAIKVERIGAQFDDSSYFPEGMNTVFTRVVNRVTLKMRGYERGIGETWACGSGACAAVVAAVLAGYCEQDTNVTVKLRGGDLTVNYHSNGEVELMGSVKTVYEGTLEI